MKLSEKTLQELRKIINGDDTEHYRSGPQLVSFFNKLGFHDVYGQGFPSRWYYTDEKLQEINGTTKLDKCMEMTFSVVDFIEEINELDELIAHFNKYLMFDKYQIKRDNNRIVFEKINQIEIRDKKGQGDNLSESDFLKLSFNVNIDNLGLTANLPEIIKSRIKEIEVCIKNNAPLAAIFLIGSVLEGLLLAVALNFPKKFNQAHCAPKDEKTGKIKKFTDWTLNNYIDTASELGILKLDVKKFSYVVRDFRNYIHPYQQMTSQFSPDKHTAIICFQVLKAAISQIGEYRINNDR